MTPRAKVEINIPDGTTFRIVAIDGEYVTVDSQQIFMMRIPASWVEQVGQAAPDPQYTDAGQHHVGMTDGRR